MYRIMKPCSRCIGGKMILSVDEMKHDVWECMNCGGTEAVKSVATNNLSPKNNWRRREVDPIPRREYRKEASTWGVR